jgi:phosphomannomutase
MEKTGQWATALDHWFGLVLATPMYVKLTKRYEPTIMYTQSVNPRYFNTVSTCLEANVAATPKVESRLGKSTPGAVRLDSTRLRPGESLQVDSSRLESMKSDFSEHFLRSMLKQGVHDS